jgi:hypothetical protein
MPRTGRRSGSSDPAHEAARDEHGRHHAARFSGFHITDLYIVWSPVGKLSGKCCASQRAWYAIERLGFFGIDLGSLEGGGGWFKFRAAHCRCSISSNLASQ